MSQQPKGAEHGPSGAEAPEPGNNPGVQGSLTADPHTPHHPHPPHPQQQQEQQRTMVEVCPSVTGSMASGTDIPPPQQQQVRSEAAAAAERSGDTSAAEATTGAVGQEEDTGLLQELHRTRQKVQQQERDQEQRKNTPCWNWQKSGTCPHESRCMFSHADR